jgi:hypothetical protein
MLFLTYATVVQMNRASVELSINVWKPSAFDDTARDLSETPREMLTCGLSQQQNKVSKLIKSSAKLMISFLKACYPDVVGWRALAARID